MKFNTSLLSLPSAVAVAYKLASSDVIEQGVQSRLGSTGSVIHKQLPVAPAPSVEAHIDRTPSELVGLDEETVVDVRAVGNEPIHVEASLGLAAHRHCEAGQAAGKMETGCSVPESKPKQKRLPSQWQWSARQPRGVGSVRLVGKQASRQASKQCHTLPIGCSMYLGRCSPIMRSSKHSWSGSNFSSF